MSARALLRKILFPPSLASCLRYRLFLPSKHPSFSHFQTKKHSFKPLFWNVDENCNVDDAMDRAGYQSKKTASKKNYSSSFLRFFYYARLAFRYLWYSSSTSYATNDNNKKRIHYSQVFTFVRVNCLHACGKYDLAKSRF